MGDRPHNLAASVPEFRPIRVLCAEDADDLAQMLETMFSFHRDVEIVGCIKTADHLVADVRRLKPDVVVLDITMPGVHPLDALVALTASREQCRVVVHSGRDDEETVRDAMKCGAHAVVSKAQDFDDLLAAVRAAAMRP